VLHLRAVYFFQNGMIQMKLLNFYLLLDITSAGRQKDGFF
jgi:hypothetical protein